ncbi:hypothetical protein BJ944DRAFT_245382 [Cunninghamella echinulata]|nr:hypothetical protein BJ944DRAFT_245382 [Cunninghamella echinulata]
MLKSITIKALLASVLVQQVIGSLFVIVKVDKVMRDGDRFVALDEYIQVNNGYSTALKSDCGYGLGTNRLPIFDERLTSQGFSCSGSKMIYFFKGAGNYLTALGTYVDEDIPCIRVDENYKFTTYVCANDIDKDLIAVPTPDPIINKPLPVPTPSTTTLKASSTSISTCTKGYCGLKAGTGKTGACCSSSDDCLDTCNSNGKCGVSDMTGEPKTGCLV